LGVTIVIKGIGDHRKYLKVYVVAIGAITSMHHG